jgi:hypothetical protein
MDECKPLRNGDIYLQMKKNNGDLSSMEAGAYTRPLRSST